MIKKEIYIWASDYSNFTGEGNLGRLFVNLNLKNKFIINICQLKFKNNVIKKTLGYKYFLPIWGIINCWIFYLKGKKVCYLNYLPLWNLVIFLLLPPKTILGPITGGSYFKKETSIDYYIRRYFFPILYTLSAYLLNLRDQKLYFSTNLLEKYSTLLKKNKIELNFVLKGINPISRTNKKRPIDFIIYFKRHKNKTNMYPTNFLKKILLYNYKIYVVGDRINLNGIINLGYLNKINLKKYLLRTKFCIVSTENILSFFSIDCINNGVKILSNIKIKKIDKKVQKNFIYFDTENFFEKNKIKKLIDFY